MRILGPAEGMRRACACFLLLGTKEMITAVLLTGKEVKILPQLLGPESFLELRGALFHVLLDRFLKE